MQFNYLDPLGYRSRPQMPVVKQVRRMIPTSQEGVLIFNYLAFNNFQDFNTWIQISKAKMQLNFEQLKKYENTKLFKCHIKLVVEADKLFFFNSGDGRSKKQAKRNALIRTINDIMWQGFVHLGFKSENWLQKLPLRQAEISFQPEFQAQQLSEISAFNKLINQLTRLHKFGQALSALEQLAKIKRPDWTDLQVLWSELLLQRQKSLIESLLKMIGKKQELTDVQQTSIACLPQSPSLQYGDIVLQSQIVLKPVKLPKANYLPQPAKNKYLRSEPQFILQQSNSLLSQLTSLEDFLTLDLTKSTAELCQILDQGLSIQTWGKKQESVPQSFQSVKVVSKGVKSKLLDIMYQSLLLFADRQLHRQISRQIFNRVRLDLSGSYTRLAPDYYELRRYHYFLEISSQLFQHRHFGQKVEGVIESSRNKQGQEITVFTPDVSTQINKIKNNFYGFLQGQGQNSFCIIREIIEERKIKLTPAVKLEGQFVLTPLFSRKFYNLCIQSLYQLTHIPPVHLLRSIPSQYHAIPHLASRLASTCKSVLLGCRSQQQAQFMKERVSKQVTVSLLGEQKGSFSQGIFYEGEESLLLNAFSKCEKVLLLGSQLSDSELGNCQAAKLGSNIPLFLKYLDARWPFPPVLSLSQAQGQIDNHPDILLGVLGVIGGNREMGEVRGVRWPSEKRFSHIEFSKLERGLQAGCEFIANALSSKFHRFQDVMLVTSSLVLKGVALRVLEHLQSKDGKLTWLRQGWREVVSVLGERHFLHRSLIVVVLQGCECEHKLQKVKKVMIRATRRVVVFSGTGLKLPWNLCQMWQIQDS